MPFVKVYLHLVWSTKNREPFLATKAIRVKVWRHILEYSRDQGIYIDFINGYTDHCHCLVSLHAAQNISKVVNLLKGESSYWINQEKLCEERFEWQNDYFAVSVSESMADKVREYIKNQEEIHKTRTFQEEFEALCRKHRFGKIE